jgi:hypothetical protein
MFNKRGEILSLAEGIVKSENKIGYTELIRYLSS